MKPSPCRSDQAPTAARFREHAGVRIVLLVSVAFLLGLASGAFWLYHAIRPEAAAPTEAVAGVVLSDATKLVLQKLPSPVTIRFYALLDPASVPTAHARISLVLEVI